MEVKKLPTLYGMDTKGRIKEWKIATEGDQIITLSGLQGGALTQTVAYAEAKNVGRANETSAEEQAEKQALSKWKAKHKKQYREQISELGYLPVLPQLALDYLKAGHRATYPAIAQPKLNGMRGLRNNNDHSFRSRENNVIRTLPHIEKQLRWLEENCPYFFGRIDGEFYIHGYHLSDIISLIKRHQEDEEKLSFYIFDIHMKGLPQQERIDGLELIQTWMANNEEYVAMHAPNIKAIESVVVNSEAEFIGYQHRWERKGFEGAMLRDPKAEYASGPAKTTAIFKRKSFQDSEFEIEDISEGSEGRAILHFTANGRPFKAEMVGSDEVTAEVFRNRASYIGKRATVKYQELSKYGVPTIGVKALVIRDYE